MLFGRRGPKMAVDPANPDVVYFGAPQGGLMVTSDGGKSWRWEAETPLIAADWGQFLPRLRGPRV